MHSLIQALYTALQNPQAPMLVAVVSGVLTFSGVVLTAVMALLAIFIRDWQIAKWIRDRDEAKLQQKKVASYVDPLMSSASKLLWRLKEVFSLDGRGLYLSDGATQTGFQLYKLRSTLYRFASLLGWIRAFRKELSYLRLSDQRMFVRLQIALGAFESALADGPHAEMERLQNLDARWHLHLKSDHDQSQLKRLSVELDHYIDSLLDLDSSAHDGKVPESADISLCQSVADFLCRSRKNFKFVVRQPVPFRCIEPKQAWLYRDWQESIGEMMIQPADNAVRRFDVADYGAFENICLSGNYEKLQPLRRLLEVIQKIDFTDDTDYRARQLWNCYKSTGELVAVLNDIAASNKDKSVHNLCRTIAALPPDYRGYRHKLFPELIGPR